MSIIRNRDQLLSHGNERGREIALKIIEGAILAVDSYDATKKAVRMLDDDHLAVADRVYDLSQTGNVYVVGAGKATISMAMALDEILGPRIKEGHVIVKHGQFRPLKRIKVTEGGHPLPTREGLRGAQRVLKIANEADEDDLVFCLISGGASALMPIPVPGISLRDKRRVSELLLGSGANIEEINSVRNHISEIKGGKLAGFIHPAQMVNLIVVDEIERRLWGPTVPDDTTFEDAFSVLNRYGIWEKTPRSIRRYIRRGLRNPSLETLKEGDFGRFRVQNIVLADNVSLCEAAKREATRLGLNSTILTTSLQGESCQVGTVLGAIADEIAGFHRPIEPPCVLILGGETTVTLGSRHGRGGPSQELALSASLSIRGSDKITVASIDTDGTDGPTEAAGGLVDGFTFEKIEESGFDPFKSLRLHDSHSALAAAGDLILTNITGTNVMDLDLVVVTE